MTVKELIDHLLTLPQDFPVIYRCCSDYAAMDKDDVQVQRDTDGLRWTSAVPHHNIPGEFRNHHGAKGIHEKPANVVIFPGN